MRLIQSFGEVMSSFREIGLTAVLVIIAGAWADRAQAAASDWTTAEFSQLRLISARDSVAGNHELDIGVQIRLAEGWKTYWRDPGDAGFSALFDWSASRNMQDVKLAWPAPKRISSGGFDSFGYENEVVFPVRVRVSNPTVPVIIHANIAYAVCKDICIPLEAHVSLEIPAGNSGDALGTEEHRILIERFSGWVPSRQGGQIEIADASVQRVDGEKVLRMRIDAREALTQPDVFIEGPTDVFFGRPRVELGSEPRTAIVEVPVKDGERSAYMSQPLTVILVDGTRAIERMVIPTTK